MLCRRQAVHELTYFKNNKKKQSRKKDAGNGKKQRKEVGRKNNEQICSRQIKFAGFAHALFREERAH